jgi:hypothetical protein
MNPYNHIYNIISDKVSTNLLKDYPIYYDYIDINEHLKIVNSLKDSNSNVYSNEYLKKLYHLITIQFGNMKDFHSDNLTYYSQNYIPSINSLISYISSVSLDNKVIKTWIKEIKHDNLSKEEYLNSISHHLIITPFISVYNIPPEIKEIINMLNNIYEKEGIKKNNLWLDVTNSLEELKDFMYREIDIKQFFKNWVLSIESIKNNKIILQNEQII